MTYSIGFRSPSKGELAREVLQRMAEQAEDEAGDAIYRDPKQEAVASSAEIPQAMLAFATEAMEAALRDPLALQRALGETLTEPKANVWFSGEEGEPVGGVRLDRRTRMLFDSQHIFINGESFRAAGRDAQLMRTLADQRYLQAKDIARLSDDARELVTDWYQAGWLYADQ